MGIKSKLNAYKHIKRQILIGSLVLVVVGVFLFIRSLSSPAQGTIKSAASVDTQVRQPQLVTYDGTHIRFTYDSDYQTKEVQKSKLYDEQLNLNRPAKGLSPSRNLALAVRLFEKPVSIEEDAGYHIRKKDAANYDHSRQRISADAVEIFTRKAGSYEKTAFWLHGTKLLSVSLTSGATSQDELDKDFQALLISVVWKGSQ